MKILLLVNRSVFNSSVANLAKRHHFSLKIVGGPFDLDFHQAWEVGVRQFDACVWLGYSLKTENSRRVFDQFIESIKNHEGAFYYAPRPNDHLEVEEAVLVGARPVLSMRPNKSSEEPKIIDSLKKIKNFLKRSGGTDFLPSENAYFIGEVQKKKARDMELGLTPVELPQNLQWCPQEWQPWRPELESERKDLIENVGSFFKAPRGIHVVLLNKCNLKCVMCPYHSPKYTAAHTSDYFDSKKSMTFETFRKIADYASENNVALQFGQIEEPLVHREVFKFIEYAKDKGIRHIHMTTNGTLLNEERAKALAESGIDSVMFSVDAASPEVYKSIRGSDLGKLENNIDRFLRYKPKNLKVSLSFILQDQAKMEREQFLKKWKSRGIDQITFYVLSEFDLESGETIRAANSEHYSKGERYPCASPWIQSVIFPEGEVSLCCKTMTDVGWRGVVSVGNINNQSFEDIWVGELYNKVRHELLENDFKEFPVCKKCEIWSASTYRTEKNELYTRTYNETMDNYFFNETEQVEHVSSSDAQVN